MSRNSKFCRQKWIMIKDSDTESEFSGFGESDLDVPHIHYESDSEASSDDELDRDDVWTKHYSNVTVEDFTERPGPNLPPDFDTATARPIDYFWLVFPLRLVELIARHTNSYATWKMIQEGEVDKDWYKVTVQEMKAFLGINIQMGITLLPDIESYWLSDPFCHNEGISNTMTCNRFQRILQYLHISDRAAEPARGEDGYDRLYKVREFMSMVQESFLQAYTLSREVSVDEAMINYSGRFSFRHYMPAKPIKRGVKVWILCDGNNSYLSRFDVYLERQTTPSKHGLCHSVVTRLTEHLHQTFRWVFLTTSSPR